MKAVTKFVSLGNLFLFVVMIYGAGCAAVGPVAVHAAPRALTARSPALLFVPVKILVPTVQTVISTTSRVLVNEVVRSGEQVKQATQKKHYEKKDS